MNVHAHKNKKMLVVLTKFGRGMIIAIKRLKVKH